jgi:hypothetical protein
MKPIGLSITCASTPPLFPPALQFLNPLRELGHMREEMRSGWENLVASAHCRSDLALAAPAAARLIELTPKEQWQITRLGQTMLAPRGYWVH